MSFGKRTGVVLALASAAVLGVFSTSSVAAQTSERMLLPQVFRSYRPSGAILGRLLNGIEPEVGAQIELVNYTPSLNPALSVENYVYTATTSATGDFVFAYPAMLQTGEHYYLRYTNPTLMGDPNAYDVTRVSTWTSYDLPGYVYDDVIAFPDINVANVEMNLNAMSVPVPYQFSWGRRVGDATEEYDFLLTDQDSAYYQTGPLGYVDHFDLATLPIGFDFDLPYIWGIHIVSQTAGEGYSFFLPVAFTLDLPTGPGSVVEAPAFQTLR